MKGLAAFRIVEHELPPHIAKRLALLLQDQNEVSEHGLGLYVIPDPQNVKAILTRRLTNARKANIEDVDLEQEVSFFNAVPSDSSVWRLHYYDEGKRWSFLVDPKNARYIKKVGEIPSFSEE
jgi:hypothetical protein